MKNLKLFCGKPLIFYTIEAALNADFIDRVVVSTEDEEIEKVSLSYGAEVIKRPQELATDKSLVQDVLIHVVEAVEKEGYKPDYIVLLNPTSPLRGREQIDATCHINLHGLADSLVSVTAEKLCLWKLDDNGIAKADYDYLHKGRTQDLPIQYRENGAIYIVKRDILMETKQFIAGKIVLFPLSKTCSFDIDDIVDFIAAERVMNEVIANQSEI